MLVITEPGDTPEKILHNVLGEVDSSYADSIWQVNQPGQERQPLSNQCKFDPATLKPETGGIRRFGAYKVIWVPGFSRIDDNPVMREQVLRQCRFIPSDGLANLADFQRTGGDIGHIVSIGRKMHLHNQAAQANDEGIAWSMGIKGVVESTARFNERASMPAEEFVKSMEHLNAKAVDWVKLLRQPGVNSNMAAIEVGRARRHVLEVLQKDASIYKGSMSPKLMKIMSSSRRLRNRIIRKGLVIDNLSEVQHFAKLARYSKWLGKGCLAFSVGLGASEVYETYREGGEWDAKLVGVAGELAIMSGIALSFTPVGWVALAATAVAEGALFAYTGNKLEHFIEHGYEGVKHFLAHWL